jgi:hypothetical protein
MPEINTENASAVLQVYDNSVYLGTDARAGHQLPGKGADGPYRIEGSLWVADKYTVKNLTARLGPVIRALDRIRKLFITPLLRYWSAPCCNQRGHISNFGLGRYLGALGESVQELRLFIRDSLFTRKVSNYRVICPNRILGLGQRPANIMDLWVKDPVHPSDEAYAKIGAFLEGDLADTGAKCTKPSGVSYKGCNKKNESGSQPAERGVGERVPGSAGQKRRTPFKTG